MVGTSDRLDRNYRPSKWECQKSGNPARLVRPSFYHPFWMQSYWNISPGVSSQTPQPPATVWQPWRVGGYLVIDSYFSGARRNL